MPLSFLGESEYTSSETARYTQKINDSLSMRRTRAHYKYSLHGIDYPASDEGYACVQKIRIASWPLYLGIRRYALLFWCGPQHHVLLEKTARQKVAFLRVKGREAYRINNRGNMCAEKKPYGRKQDSCTGSTLQERHAAILELEAILQISNSKQLAVICHIE